MLHTDTTVNKKPAHATKAAALWHLAADPALAACKIKCQIATGEPEGGQVVQREKRFITD